MFVFNKQRKHGRSFGFTGCWPWPLIDKVFFLFFFFLINGCKRMATIMSLTRCRVCSEECRGSFPKAGLLSLSFHHSKDNWWHQSSTAVDIKKFSCCTDISFKQPSVFFVLFFFFFTGVDIRSISGRQFTIVKGPVTIIQETQSFHWNWQRRVVLIPFKLHFLLPTRPHGFWAS